MKSFPKILFALTLFMSTRPAFAQQADAEKLHELIEFRHEWESREFPEHALRRGDFRYADRLTDNNVKAAHRRAYERSLMRTKLEDEIDPEQLDEADRVDYEILHRVLDREIRNYNDKALLFAIGKRFGAHQKIAKMADYVRFATEEDYENYLARLEQLPEYIDNEIEILTLGVRHGYTVPKIALEGVDQQLIDLSAEGGLEALEEPFNRIPKTIPDDRQMALRLRFENKSLPAAYEAINTLKTFFIDGYYPNCREEIGASALNEGAAFYQHQLEFFTTTDKNAGEIHKLGLREVARIKAEMLHTIRRSDYLELHPDHASLDEEELFAAFLNYLRTDPRFYYDDPDALLAEYRNICKKVDAWLPRFFGFLPRLPYGVRAIPDYMAPYQTTAYYEHGSLETGEPGWFAANTYALDQRPKYEMIALAMHEAVPGHHLQIAIAQELEDIPEFRKHTWFTAFGEGWALYSERLGLEMGLYDDPYDDFGRLLYEMWRACRLVVDTGIHAYNWTREQAIRYMLDNTALSELNIENEVDRYISWPGQACAYKIGELRIRTLRLEAEEKLGAGFDLREFHDVVLGAGSIPLDVLKRRVHDWIRSKPIGLSYD